MLILLRKSCLGSNFGYSNPVATYWKSVCPSQLATPIFRSSGTKGNKEIARAYLDEFNRLKQ